MPSDRDKQQPRPNPQIGAEHGVESSPLSERSRRASESAGQSSLSYASSGPTNVPAPAQVQTDMPPVILDPASTEDPDTAPMSFESVSKVQAKGPPPPPPSAPGSAPASAPHVVAHPSNASSGAFRASPALTPTPPPVAVAGAVTPRPPLTIADLPPMRSASNTVVVRDRRASPVEKAVAFAVALLLICLIGAAAFWWGRSQ